VNNQAKQNIPYKETAEGKLAAEVTADFLARQEERRFLERGWQLNMNFVSGNQYCDINALGELEEEDPRWWWQTKRVFNYIAPTIDTRLAKLSRIRPALTVCAATEEESDVHSAKLASSVLSAVREECNLDEVISDATVWSETCGTVFYKIVWDNGAGANVGITEDGKKVYEGDVKIVSVSPFEIYPWSLSEEKLEDQPSIIHAKALPVEDILAIYGVELEGRDIDDFALSPYSEAAHARAGLRVTKAVKHGYEVVIEKYERPTFTRPEGRLTVVAGGRLLYDGDLPYCNGENKTRGYPFVRQVCLHQAGAFFGGSIVDRLIPVQRAYNAVKNRKHEFLNRISMGTVAVEDGSVDTDELAEEGLRPGKILVYRQGGKAPEMLTLGSVPSEFTTEEENLQKEFARIAGTNDLTQSAESFTSVTSATGLQLIIDQDDARLNNTYQSVKDALKGIGKQVIRLYRQFATEVHLKKCAGEGNALKLFYFRGDDLSSDDVNIVADSDSNMTAAQKRTVLYEMIDKGLFSDENGRLGQDAKCKILDAMGYGSFVGERNLTELQRAKAGEENLTMLKEECPVKEYDDHKIHIAEHTAFLLSEKPDSITEERIVAHMQEHKKRITEENING
jgi:hypothetical protein